MKKFSPRGLCSPAPFTRAKGVFCLGGEERAHIPASQLHVRDCQRLTHEQIFRWPTWREETRSGLGADVCQVPALCWAWSEHLCPVCQSCVRCPAQCVQSHSSAAFLPHLCARSRTWKFFQNLLANW